MHPDSPATSSDLSGVLLSAARSYLDREEWDEAERCLREVLGLGHHRTDAATRTALTWLGHVDHGRGDDSAALARWGDTLSAHAEARDGRALAETLCDIASLHLDRGELDESERAAERSLRASSPLDLPDLRARSLETLGTVLRLRGDLDGARAHHEEALDLRVKAGDLAGQARNHTGLGNTYHRLGRLEDALSHHRQCLAIFESLPDERGVAKALNNIGTNLLEQGDYEGSADHFRRSREIVEKVGDPRMMAHIVSNLGLVASYQGDTDAAERYYRESLEAREAVHDVAGQAISLNNLAHVTHMAGRYEESIAFAERSIDLRLRAGLKEGIDRPLFNLATSFIELDRFREAEQAARRVDELGSEQPSLEARIQSNILSGMLAIRQNNAEAAKKAAERAIELAEEGRLPRQRGEALRLDGEAALELGDLERARERLLLAEHVYRDLNAPYPLARCRLSLGQLFLRVGACEAAADRLRRAARVFQQLGNDLLRWRALIGLAESEWPLSRHQARVTLAEAGDLARQLDRPDFAAETEALADDLVRRRATSGESPDAGIVVGLGRGLRDETDATSALQRSLEYLVTQLELDVAFAEFDGATRDRIGPHPASAPPPPDFTEDLVRRARRTREPQFKVIGDGEPILWSAVPIHGFARAPLGILCVCRSNNVEPSEQGTPPHVVRLIEACASLIGLALTPMLAKTTTTSTDTVERGRVFHGLVGESSAMRTIYQTIERIAPTETSVLVQGESGTGKELVAKAIHAVSRRVDGPFVAISCPSIPRELIESELFGHEKGAFTGAHTSRMGHIEAANEGTLFLDEIGDMDLATQSKLLRFLQEREFTRVGGRGSVRVNVRLVAATSRNLEDEIRRGRFREDLFYRISVAPVRLPPLRSRPGDVARLAEHFLDEFAESDRSLAFEPDVLDLLSRHPWPGNVRELRNLIEFLVAMAQGDTISVDQIPTKIRSQVGSSSPFTDAPREEASPLRPGETLESRLMSVEGALIRDALEASNWVQSRAAALLGITESKIRHRMKRYGIRRTT